MQQKINISMENDYLVFEIEGRDSLEFSLEYWQKVGEECKSRGCHKALIIENLTGETSTLDVFKLSEKLPEFIKGLQVAFIDKNEDDTEQNAFGETVTQNRGGVVKIFSDVDSAKKWLA